MAAIEKLIGQPIPRAEGDYAVHSEASDEDAAPRRSRSRDGSRDGARGGRKPRREREPRNGEREPRHDREPQQERAAKPEREPRNGRSGAPQATPSHVPSIGRAEPRRQQREVDHEPADHSHLPAFLLRPVRARA